MLPHPHPPNTASFLLCHHSCAFFIVLEFCSLSESAAACLLPSPLSMLHILTVQSCGQNASHFFMVACHWGHGLCNAIFWFVLSNNSKCKCKIKKSKKWRATSALDYLLLWPWLWSHQRIPEKFPFLKTRSKFLWWTYMLCHLSFLLHHQRAPLAHYFITFANSDKSSNEITRHFSNVFIIIIF